MPKQNDLLSKDLPLGIDNYSYADLYNPLRLKALHTDFHEYVKRHDVDLFNAFQAYQLCQGEDMSAQNISDLLVRMAPYVNQFIAQLFQIEAEVALQAQNIQQELDTIFLYQQEIVKKVKAIFKNQDIKAWDIAKIRHDLYLLQSVAFPQTIKDADTEKGFCRMVSTLIRLQKHYQLLEENKNQYVKNAAEQISAMQKLLNENAQAKAVFDVALAKNNPGDFVTQLLELIHHWTYAAQHDPELIEYTSDWTSFKSPQKVDWQNLVPHMTKKYDSYSTWTTPESKRRHRDGFALTDPRYNTKQVLHEINHCIYCHERDTDSCSKGMKNKKSGAFKTNKLGSTVIGCPLEEKISEMHVVKKKGYNIGALALIIIDNPMCPGTGHRICNDCMQGCIFQKTEPVNIPQIETNALTDVLFLPWGFEIYSLLTRWNPLNIKRPYPLAYNGKNILVVGLGPAGYTLAHYLINEGFGVVGIDALKIEPLPSSLTSTSDQLPAPLKDFKQLYEDLDQRIPNGFGGVSEYGITARWDKNFLKVIYLNLIRRQTFNCYGGIRFGGTITIEDAWDLGFHHIAIASGAGKPSIIGLKNNLIRGIRKASDFLMALQLTGAAKKSSLSNLQISLPAGVIGGGLTALDTATEVMAYYPIQVEKILYRYEKLVADQGEAAVRKLYDNEEIVTLDRFLKHGRAIRAQRAQAKKTGKAPNFQPLIDQWGGVTLFYRKGIKNSPAYRQNHQEVQEAICEGIQLAEGMNPIEAIPDEYGTLKAVKFDVLVEQDGQWISKDNLADVALRSLFIAAGTEPNTIYQDEKPNTFVMDGKFFQCHELTWDAKSPKLVPIDTNSNATLPKLSKPAPLTSYCENGKFISFYGDNHPVYSGNVVKAMASAKNGYPYICKIFANELSKLDPKIQSSRDQSIKKLFADLDAKLLATIIKINKLAPKITEVIVKAPMQANKFQPGQFYRVQDFSGSAPVLHDTVLATEGLALTGASVDKEKGIISLIALEIGSSSQLCRLWKPGEPLVVMGVTGTATTITKKKTVMLIGGGLGNAVQFSIGKALRAADNHVIYFAGYKSPQDIFKVSDIEAAADVIVWAVDPADGVQAIKTNRPQDKTYVGNIIEAIIAYAKNDLGETSIKLQDVDHMIVIGSDRMMAAVQKARSEQLKPYLSPEHTAIGSINSPMQCMMKGICAQCLCKHVDKESGKEYFVYSCSNQDQYLDKVDFVNLAARLRQNSVQEKLSNDWVNYVLDE